MNLLSPLVLGAAGICASPALYQAVVTGGMPLEVAMSRYLIALGICWVAISLVAMIIGEPPTPSAGSIDPGADMERPPGLPSE